MLRYISIRLLYMVPVIWLVVSVVFLMIHLVPGDPIQQMLGEGAPAADLARTTRQPTRKLRLSTRHVELLLHANRGLCDGQGAGR